MYSAFQLTLKYLRYYLVASNGKGHGMHSPFIFHFITKVLSDKKHYKEYEVAENHRKKLLKDQTILVVEDFGAGSSINKTNKRTIASIAKNAAKSPKYGQLLFRIVKEYKPETIIELGTSLGITTSYLALANKKTHVITMEGSGAIADRAANNFKLLDLTNIDQIVGNFDDILQPVIEHLSFVNMVFIDGNHRREPTERYFEQLLSKINNDSILIFDDIHWSSEMEEAWETIKKNEAVRCSIDLFFIGIVFFRKEFKEKQHFVIRF